MLEEIIYQHLISQTELLNQLTSYAGNLAIFNSEAPTDLDAGWESSPQYPRLVFRIDMQSDANRVVNGLLYCDVITTKAVILPEVLEPKVKAALEGYFLADTAVGIFNAKWYKSIYFANPEEPTIGVTLVFELLAYPDQSTAEPDTVRVLNAWLAANFPELIIIGESPLAPVFLSSDTNPAAYWQRLSQGSCDWRPEALSGFWTEEVLSLHLMAPSLNVREAKLKVLLQALRKTEVIPITEGQYLWFKPEIKSDISADPYSKGQLTLRVAYIYPEIPEAETRINHYHLEGAD